MKGKSIDKRKMLIFLSAFQYNLLFIYIVMHFLIKITALSIRFTQGKLEVCVIRRLCAGVK